MGTTLRPRFELVLSNLKEFGLLLETDTKLPSLSGLVAGEPISGSWWAPRSHEIFAVLQQVVDHKDVFWGSRIMRTRSHYLLRGVFLLTVLAAWPASLTVGQAQPPHPTPTRQAISYAFVSPNTRENLTLQEAIAGLSSPDEQRLIDETRLLSCRLHQVLRVQRAVGSWTDGAENSTVVRVTTDEARLRYSSSWLGKFARQKAVLYFRRNSFGGARMYVLLLSRPGHDMKALASELDADGIANRTLVRQKEGMLIYVVDLTNELRPKVLAAVRRLHARLSTIRGDGEFIGDDDRDKAQTIFEREIVRYEVRHPRALRPCRQKISRALSFNRVSQVSKLDLASKSH